MTTAILEWLNLGLRWFHIMAGIAWIGSSFLFIALESGLRRRAGQPDGVEGDIWLVHGGGFYRAEKYAVAPESLPDELLWFKYEAYFTWLTGFALLALIYYAGADAFLIDRNKWDLTPWQATGLSVASLAAGWLIYDRLCKSPLRDRTGPLASAVFVLIVAATLFYTAVFSDRAAFLHIGAFIGTIMVGSVFFVIIPNQKIVVADLVAGRTPDPAFGRQAFQRSLHNNYLTLPVVFMMVSSHYPIVFGHPLSWLIALGIVVVGGLIRHVFNAHHRGKLDSTAQAAIPLALMLLVGLALLTGYRPDLAASGSVAFSDVEPVIRRHCVACHAARPTNADFPEAPKGVMLEAPADIRRHAPMIHQQVVLSDIMPLGNETGMTDAERALIAGWVAAGAPIAD